MADAHPWETEQVRDRVAKRLSEFLHARRPALDEISPDVGALVDDIADFLDGGKRLRPVFLYWGWRAGGGPDTDSIIAAAAAMEFLQACALIHDDVMDASDSRRGRPAMHRRFEDQHRDAGFGGDPARFGEGAAILVGDLCLSWADEMLFEADLEPAALRRAKPVYDAMRAELMAGQYLDLLAQSRRDESVEAALLVATYKSAKYTIERPLHLGAALAGAEPGVISALRTYGVALGRAFQLRDDLLGVFGDPGATGKPAGDDLREGKRTALVALALQRCTPSERALLESGLGNRAATDQQVAELATLVERSGARTQIEAMIAAEAGTARTALAGAALPALPTRVLSNLISVAAERTT